MAERIRNTKKLAQRIDRGYLKRDFWLPRWKRLLTIAATTIGVAWLGWQSLSGKQEAFNAGPLAHAHAVLAKDCATCHVQTAAFSAKVTDTRRHFDLVAEALQGQRARVYCRTAKGESPLSQQCPAKQSTAARHRLSAAIKKLF